MSLAEEAFLKLYPEKANKYSFILKYTAKFKPYNANARLYQNTLKFSLSKSWKKVSKDIQIGLIQELLVKILKDKKGNKRTIEMDLYNIFIKNVHLAIPKTETEPVLEDSFQKLNEKFFSGMMERPNLKWGNNSVRRLGCYEYGSDTITVSTIFKDADRNLLDYVMYHEMLHKKLKFNSKNKRNLHHSPEFKKMESQFENANSIEKEISKLARKYRFSIRIF